MKITHIVILCDRDEKKLGDEDKICILRFWKDELVSGTEFVNMGKDLNYLLQNVFYYDFQKMFYFPLLFTPNRDCKSTQTISGEVRFSRCLFSCCCCWKMMHRESKIWYAIVQVLQTFITNMLTISFPTKSLKYENW